LLVPNYQISGAAIATVLSYIIMAWLFIITLRKQMRMSLFCKRDVLIIAAGTLCMSLALGVYSIMFNLFLIFNTGRMFTTVFALTGVVIGASVFTAMILRMNLFSAKELAFLPGGTKFISKGKNSR
jgi:O-antigen/teichoic acid export membrane protein